jgi:hypothetical protein
MLCGVAQSPSYELIHTRRIFFLADEYWVIHDRLRGDQPHHIDLRFHLASAAWEKTTVVASGRQSAVCAPGVALVFHAPALPCIEPGWVAPQYGTKLSAPVISLLLEKRESADFITLIAPNHSPECLPRLNVCLDRADGSDAIAVEVNGVGPSRSATDHLSWGSAVVSHEAGPFACRASAIWWRSEHDDSPTSLTACNVQELKWKHNGRREFLSTLAPSEWLCWDGSSTKIAEQGGR